MHIIREIKYLYIYSTLKCNLSCKHCIINSCPNRTEIIEYNEFNFLKTELMKISPDKINITGGEPFTYPYLVDLVNLVTNINKTASVSVSTNGTIFNNTLISKLECYLDSINLSIDGFQSDHDYLRGENTFNLIQQNLPKFLSLKCKINVNILFWDRNKSYINELINYLISHYNINEIRILRLLPFGRAESYIKDVENFYQSDLLEDLQCTKLDCHNCDSHISKSIFPGRKSYPCHVKYVLDRQKCT